MKFRDDILELEIDVSQDFLEKCVMVALLNLFHLAVPRSIFKKIRFTKRATGETTLFTVIFKSKASKNIVEFICVKLNTLMLNVLVEKPHFLSTFLLQIYRIF